jgi:anti-sigma regulatory factor (Ser/Thr protein kinase)
LLGAASAYCSWHMSALALRHDAFVYESDEAFTDRIVPFLTDGLAAGDATVAVTTRANLSLLRDALGDAAERVSFLDRDEWYSRPAKVLAAYDHTLRMHLGAGAPRVRVVGEIQFGSTPDEWDEWTVYESLLNRAFADRPAWIVCPYDCRALPDAVVLGAAHTHAQVLTDDWHDSPHYDDPARLVRSLTPAPEPLLQLRAVPLDTDSRAFRERLAREMAADGVPDARAGGMLVAATEILSNITRHGDGPSGMRVGRVGERFVCELSDRGPGLDDPFAGYMPPGATQVGGAGLWVVRQVTWRLDLLTTPDGLTVRLWV